MQLNKRDVVDSVFRTKLRARKENTKYVWQVIWGLARGRETDCWGCLSPQEREIKCGLFLF